MEKKALRIGKFNIVDIIAVVLLLLVVCYGAFRLLRQDEAVDASTIPITYRVYIEDVPAELYETSQAHLPAQLMDKNGMLDGWIQSVEKTPFMVLSSDGQWVEDPDHVNLYFNCTANVPNEAIMTTKIGEQEIRIGRMNYILKCEYVELQGTTVVDIQWGE